MAFAIGKFHTTVAHVVNRNSCVSSCSNWHLRSIEVCNFGEILSLQIAYTQHRTLIMIAKYLHINDMLIYIA